METRQIKGYENLYEVTEFGKVFAMERTVKSGKNFSCVRFYERKEKPQRFDKYGYLRVSLSKDGKVKTISVHRLVAITFCEGNSKLTVNHKDGNKLNNHYSNLEFISSSENVKHAFRTGLKKPPKVKVGIDNPKAKLTENDVREIRESKLTVRKLSELFKVHHSVINGVKNGKRYYNVI